jgi:hypothetical protein
MLALGSDLVATAAEIAETSNASQPSVLISWLSAEILRQ